MRTVIGVHVGIVPGKGVLENSCPVLGRIGLRVGVGKPDKLRILPGALVGGRILRVLPGRIFRPVFIMEAVMIGKILGIQRVPEIEDASVLRHAVHRILRHMQEFMRQRALDSEHIDVDHDIVPVVLLDREGRDRLDAGPAFRFNVINKIIFEAVIAADHIVKEPLWKHFQKRPDLRLHFPDRRGIGPRRNPVIRELRLFHPRVRGNADAVFIVGAPDLLRALIVLSFVKVRIAEGYDSCVFSFPGLLHLRTSDRHIFRPHLRNDELRPLIVRIRRKHEKIPEAADLIDPEVARGSQGRAPQRVQRLFSVIAEHQAADRLLGAEIIVIPSGQIAVPVRHDGVLLPGKRVLQTKAAFQIVGKQAVSVPVLPVHQIAGDAGAGRKNSAFPDLKGLRIHGQTAVVPVLVHTVNQHALLRLSHDVA